MSRPDGNGKKPRRKNEVAAGLPRREFMKLGALGALSTPLVSAPATADTTAPASAVLSGPVAIELRVNGKMRKVRVEPRVTLLDTLRNRLDLTGAKKVCDRGTCGACTVLLDGQAVYACSVLAIEAPGHDIRTVEGLGRPEQLHPLQAAFVENDAQQCGFCTPGFVMACSALLAEHPRPTPEQVRAHLGGNLCRCGTYMGIRRAVGETASVTGDRDGARRQAPQTRPSPRGGRRG